MTIGPIGWQCGFEIELLAPRGGSRADLAAAWARAAGGRVSRVLHPDSEHSFVQDRPVFHNLTLGFEAMDATGALVGRAVDDQTLLDDLDRQAPPRPGWWRVVTDDERLVRILARHIDAEAPLPEALRALPAALGAEIEACEGGVWRVLDAMRAPLALVAGLPGERERPCEVVTPPIREGHAERLEALLAPARALGFTVPVEGATHVHFDAGPLQDARVVANLVALLSHRALQLRRLCATPSTFRRVGGWSPALLDCVLDPDFAGLDWETARSRLAEARPTKYCDYNLRNLAFALPHRHTFEVRIFGATLETPPVVAAAALFEGILRRCVEGGPVRPRLPAAWSLGSVRRFLADLPLDSGTRAWWLDRARAAELSSSV